MHSSSFRWHVAFFQATLNDAVNQLMLFSFIVDQSIRRSAYMHIASNTWHHHMPRNNTNKIHIDLAGLSPTYLTFSTLKLKKLPTKNLTSLRAKQVMAPRSSCSLKMQTRTQKGKIPMTRSQKRFGTRNDTGHVSCISIQEFAPFWRAGGRA